MAELGGKVLMDEQQIHRFCAPGQFALRTRGPRALPGASSLLGPTPTPTPGTGLFSIHWSGPPRKDVEKKKAVPLP